MKGKKNMNSSYNRPEEIQSQYLRIVGYFLIKTQLALLKLSTHFIKEYIRKKKSKIKGKFKFVLRDISNCAQSLLLAPCPWSTNSSFREPNVMLVIESGSWQPLPTLQYVWP